jgi:hypothetical protein
MKEFNYSDPEFMHKIILDNHGEYSVGNALLDR